MALHSQRGFAGRDPIALPATLFAAAWVPYVVVFFRKTIAFGDLGGAFSLSHPSYWTLFLLQMGVCVVSHSLTPRTIIRLYAPRWLIWGSMAFFALSPIWGLLTAADIRHPLFAAVFCVFVSSLAFILYERKTAPWAWVQLGGGALVVCLLRGDGALVVMPTLGALVAYELWKRHRETREGRIGEGLAGLRYLAPTAEKRSESKWSDVGASFLALTAVGLLAWLGLTAAGPLPLASRASVPCLKRASWVWVPTRRGLRT